MELADAQEKLDSEGQRRQVAEEKVLEATRNLDEARKAGAHAAAQLKETSESMAKM